MAEAQECKGKSAAKKLVAAHGRHACDYAVHEALRARAANDQARERVWTEILDAIIAQQKAARHLH